MLKNPEKLKASSKKVLECMYLVQHLTWARNTFGKFLRYECGTRPYDKLHLLYHSLNMVVCMLGGHGMIIYHWVGLVLVAFCKMQAGNNLETGAFDKLPELYFPKIDLCCQSPGP